jgi:hypothetical protein
MTYNPGTGRFLSLDPLAGHLEDPQSLNKYNYARNDPINLDDPSGQDFLGVGIGIAIGAALMADPEVFGPAGGVNRQIAAQNAASQANLLKLQERLDVIDGEMSKAWPELYKAMGWKDFWPQLKGVARTQISGVGIDPALIPAADYKFRTDYLWLQRPVDKIPNQTLIHEVVHAWDDQKDWYLNFFYFLHTREYEGLGYGSQVVYDAFYSLVRLRRNQKSDPANFQASWRSFWRPFLNPTGVHDEDVYVDNVVVGKVNNNDLADVKAKLGIAAEYAKIAPLFDLPPTPDF